jgi:hypothetical protein
MSSAVSQKEQVHDWFLNNPNADYRDAASEFEIPYDTVKEWGKTEGWYRERALLHPESENIGEQAERLRGVVASRIMEEGETLHAKDLSELVKSWTALAAFAPPVEEEGEDREAILDLLNETD